MGLLSYFKENKELKKQVSDLEFSIRANKIMLDKMQRELENIRLNSYISCLSSINQNQQNICQRYNMLDRINYPYGGIVYV